ncbi:hypothetical protein BJ742DRAFT_743261 [Cladochytrium replicatum]|nr:hypothetical protein BJ742DRAFT_743261 [Cladochytrium replicatum]
MSGILSLILEYLLGSSNLFGLHFTRWALVWRNWTSSCARQDRVKKKLLDFQTPFMTWATTPRHQPKFKSIKILSKMMRAGKMREGTMILEQTIDKVTAWLDGVESSDRKRKREGSDLCEEGKESSPSAENLTAGDNEAQGVPKFIDGIVTWERIRESQVPKSLSLLEIEKLAQHWDSGPSLRICNGRLHD